MFRKLWIYLPIKARAKLFRIFRSNKTVATKSGPMEPTTNVKKIAVKSKPPPPPWLPYQEATHTYQFWEDSDYRNARFIDRPKHVNRNFSYHHHKCEVPYVTLCNMMYCEGNVEIGKHPKYFMNLNTINQPHYCFYCGASYVRVLSPEDKEKLKKYKAAAKIIAEASNAAMKAPSTLKDPPPEPPPPKPKPPDSLGGTPLIDPKSIVCVPCKKDPSKDAKDKKAEPSKKTAPAAASDATKKPKEAKDLNKEKKLQPSSQALIIDPKKLVDPKSIVCVPCKEGPPSANASKDAKDKKTEASKPKDSIVTKDAAEDSKEGKKLRNASWEDSKKMTALKKIELQIYIEDSIKPRYAVHDFWKEYNKITNPQEKVTELKDSTIAKDVSQIAKKAEDSSIAADVAKTSKEAGDSFLATDVANALKEPKGSKEEKKLRHPFQDSSMESKRITEPKEKVLTPYKEDTIKPRHAFYDAWKESKQISDPKEKLLQPYKDDSIMPHKDLTGEIKLTELKDPAVAADVAKISKKVEDSSFATDAANVSKEAGDSSLAIDVANTLKEPKGSKEEKKLRHPFQDSSKESKSITEPKEKVLTPYKEDTIKPRHAFYDAWKESKQITNPKEKILQPYKDDSIIPPKDLTGEIKLTDLKDPAIAEDVAKVSKKVEDSSIAADVAEIAKKAEDSSIAADVAEISKKAEDSSIATDVAETSKKVEDSKEIRKLLHPFQDSSKESKRITEPKEKVLKPYKEDTIKPRHAFYDAWKESKQISDPKEKVLQPYKDDSIMPPKYLSEEIKLTELKEPDIAADVAEMSKKSEDSSIAADAAKMSKKAEDSSIAADVPNISKKAEDSSLLTDVTEASKEVEDSKERRKLTHPFQDSSKEYKRITKPKEKVLKPYKEDTIKPRHAFYDAWKESKQITDPKEKLLQPYKDDSIMPPKDLTGEIKLTDLKDPDIAADVAKISKKVEDSPIPTDIAKKSEKVDDSKERKKFRHAFQDSWKESKRITEPKEKVLKPYKEDTIKPRHAFYDAWKESKQITDPKEKVLQPYKDDSIMPPKDLTGEIKLTELKEPATARDIAELSKEAEDVTEEKKRYPVYDSLEEPKQITDHKGKTLIPSEEDSLLRKDISGKVVPRELRDPTKSTDVAKTSKEAEDATEEKKWRHPFYDNWEKPKQVSDPKGNISKPEIKPPKDTAGEGKITEKHPAITTDTGKTSSEEADEATEEKKWRHPFYDSWEKPKQTSDPKGNISKPEIKDSIKSHKDTAGEGKITEKYPAITTDTGKSTNKEASEAMEKSNWRHPSYESWKEPKQTSDPKGIAVQPHIEDSIKPSKDIAGEVKTTKTHPAIATDTGKSSDDATEDSKLRHPLYYSLEKPKQSSDPKEKVVQPHIEDSINPSKDIADEVKTHPAIATDTGQSSVEATEESKLRHPLYDSWEKPKQPSDPKEKVVQPHIEDSINPSKDIAGEVKDTKLKYSATDATKSKEAEDETDKKIYINAFYDSWNESIKIIKPVIDSLPPVPDTTGVKVEPFKPTDEAIVKDTERAKGRKVPSKYVKPGTTLLGIFKDTNKKKTMSLMKKSSKAAKERKREAHQHLFPNTPRTSHISREGRKVTVSRITVTPPKDNESKTIILKEAPNLPEDLKKDTKGRVLSDSWEESKKITDPKAKIDKPYLEEVKDSEKVKGSASSEGEPKPDEDPNEGKGEKPKS